jgi:hypothetical protein
MAGGAGGAGGNPGGIGGTAGSSSVGYVVGGQGGNNGVIFEDGYDTFGPYGQGANGSDSNSPVGRDGNDGAVIITWGGGLSAVKYTAPTIVTVTSAGVTPAAGGYPGTPGQQLNITTQTYVNLNYAPISRYWKANSTDDTRFAWTRALGFRSPVSSVSNTDLTRWGFDVADVAPADNISLVNFSANINNDFSIGYAVIKHGTNSITQSVFFTLGMLSEATSSRQSHSSDSNPFSDGSTPYGLGPWVIPSPKSDEFVYLWVSDNSGSDTRSVTVTYST